MQRYNRDQYVRRKAAAMGVAPYELPPLRKQRGGQHQGMNPRKSHTARDLDTAIAQWGRA